MKRATDTWEELLGSVYDAALDPGCWPIAIERIADLLEARQAKIAVTSLAEHEELRVVLHRLDPALQQRWFSEFAHRDPWTQSMAYLPRGFVASGSEVVPPAELRQSEIYHEFLRPDRVEDILGAWLGDGPRGISHLIVYRDTLFDRRQVRLLARLAPHLRRAVRAQEQLLALGERTAALELALDRLRAGVFLLAADGSVIFANEAAQALARDADGLAWRRGKLHLERPDELRRFEGLVRAAAALGDESPRSHSLVASRRPGRRPLSLLITPIRPRERLRLPLLPPDLLARAAVLITVTDPDDVVPPAAEHLALHFGLTPAEARLAAALAARLSIDECAAKAGVSVGTARWTLKRILEKTGCRRQSELVQLLATSAGGVIRG